MIQWKEKCSLESEINPRLQRKNNQNLESKKNNERKHMKFTCSKNQLESHVV
jgi:hypothetical protein